MKLSTKSQYAVSAMIEIALQHEMGPTPLSDLAASHRISLSYAEQLFACLRRDGLVRGTRGPGGGFSLTRPPEEITIAQIVRSIYGQEQKSDKQNTVDHVPTCLWYLLDARIEDFLQGVTLADALSPLTQIDRHMETAQPSNTTV